MILQDWQMEDRQIVNLKTHLANRRLIYQLFVHSKAHHIKKITFYWNNFLYCVHNESVGTLPYKMSTQHLHLEGPYFIKKLQKLNLICNQY